MHSQIYYLYSYSVAIYSHLKYYRSKKKKNQKKEKRIKEEEKKIIFMLSNL
jgi:hypothetical protein